MNHKITVEVCAGSLEDCRKAHQAGAQRIELNNALYLGGLTPSIGTLIQAKKITDIPIVCMIRSRAGGFSYNEDEIMTMIEDAKYLIDAGADGLAFGFLNEDGTIDKETTRYFVQICHEADREAVFHRAFDRVSDPIQAIEDLIECGITRILTSGLEPDVVAGIPLIKMLIQDYSDDIEFVVGAGVNHENVIKIIRETGVNQVHSSFKGWFIDPTTRGEGVSYGYSEHGDYEGVDMQKLDLFMKCIHENPKI